MWKTWFSCDTKSKEKGIDSNAETVISFDVFMYSIIEGLVICNAETAMSSCFDFMFLANSYDHCLTYSMSLPLFAFWHL